MRERRAAVSRIDASMPDIRVPGEKSFSTRYFWPTDPIASG
jgi:hypothetical protein